MRIGVDYYPEHWPEARWPVDARMMAEAGISVVRLAEFAWSKMEPREGEFHFDWLEKAIDVMAAEGIQVVLGTPTASPPAWLMAKYPDTYPLDEYGHTYGFGTRQHRCHSPENYRRRCRAVVEAMADRFGENPEVIGWQIDNEFHREDCICGACTAKWRDWLQNKYGSLEKLNAAWGTIFWSQEYFDWTEIPPLLYPRCGLRAHNPSLILDWRRFQSENVVSFQKEQVEIIRRYSPGRFITHNFMGLHDSVNYYDLARDLDLVAWDNYPDEGSAAVGHDLTRGLKNRNFWLMEERAGHMGWDKLSRSPRPGELRMWAWEAFGHGADAVVFFRWRSCLYGTEQFWQGILNHDAVPRRRYHEIARLGAEVKRLSPLIDGSSVENEVAVFNDYENIWALDIQPQTEGFSFRKVQLAYTGAFARLGVGTDVIGADVDFKRYKVVIFPPLYVLSGALAKKISDYVEGGGAAVLNCRSGVKNEANVCRTEPLPTLLSAMAGLEVSEYDAVGAREVQVEMADGKDFKASLWCDVLSPMSANPVAFYKSNFYAGEAAVCVNSCGKGKVWYVGTVGEPAFYTEVVRMVLEDRGVGYMRDLPEGVGVSRRTRDGSAITFICNFTEQPKAVALPGVYSELITGATVKEMANVEPFGVAILKKAEHGGG